MKALIVYTLLVAAGILISGFVGMWVENNFGPATSLIVFLAMFFANFVVCWLVTMLVMDGSLRGGPAAVPAK